jgi:ribonucleoside-diphosphate reductase alpha chain
MRSMMTAGPALKKCNIAGYNCSYLPIDHPHAFDEVLYILMNGTGACLCV